MIAKLVTRCVTLDYTGVAAPLTADTIAEDITETQVNLCAEPEKLILWEHQLDWIKKSIPGRYGTEYTWECCGLISITPSKSPDGGVTIWGIPVEVRTA